MQFGTGRHASDELLEQHSMGRLDERTSQDLEEHLLICAGCQDNLALTEAYRKCMKRAALELRQVSSQARYPVKKSFGGLFRLPKPVWAMAALALVIAAGSRWPSIHRSAAQPALVLLQSNRGAESPLNSSTPTAKPFTLMLDLTDLPPLPQYRLEIVDATGRAVFGLTAAPENSKLSATIAKGLPGGMYYVRVYGQELLREYGLEARN
jgi:hypothetical protein